VTLTPARLTELEVASGLVLGPDPATPALRLPEEPLHPVRALELALLPALLRPPCLVSFSGGRDSSVVLAVSARLARREGLDLPVPVTFRYPTAPETNESEWQEMIVRRLALPEWRCRDVGDELDLLGPVAQRVLLRHGVLYPPNVHI
jgi:asparagine synthase (glutamine-hydrolysing)